MHMLSDVHALGQAAYILKTLFSFNTIYSLALCCLTHCVHFRVWRNAFELVLHTKTTY